jgi:hypothetical protein
MRRINLLTGVNSITQQMSHTDVVFDGDGIDPFFLTVQWIYRTIRLDILEKRWMNVGWTIRLSRHGWSIGRHQEKCRLQERISAISSRAIILCLPR